MTNMTNQNQVSIQQLTSGDAEAFQAIRLEALQGSPEAYGSTFELERDRAIEEVAKKLERTTVFGAFDGSCLVGVAGFFIEDGAKTKHKGVLWGMYVQPAARKTGIGKQLVEAVIDFAAKHVELLHLTVVKENQAAIKLYESLGFKEYGIEERALKHDDCYSDEVLMAKHLREQND